MPGEVPFHDADAHGGNPNLLTLTSILHGALSAADGLADMTPLEFAGLHMDAARRVVEAGQFVGMAAMAAEPSFASGDVAQPEVSREVVRAWHASALALLVIESVADRRTPDAVPPMSARLRARAQNELGPNLDQFMPEIPLLGIVSSEGNESTR